MSLVVLTAQVDGNIYTVLTHLHVVDILAYMYCIFVHLTSLFEVWGSKVKATYEILVLFIVNIIQSELLYIDCDNWWYICSFLHEDGIIVFQGQSSRSQVKHCCSCQKKYIMIGSAMTDNFDTDSYLKLKRKCIFFQGKRSYLSASL